ncbi:17816_t:CDS:2 [Cetraspora pellucida]|uniref:17816_t:CDS:1 n=1 Tax=Cetraspora pellucida TaxID=1433469 RepID=A0A9N9NQC4_9GLOM|nr:17816_t:CDS:2 [Cetraspora pellucida]
MNNQNQVNKLRRCYKCGQEGHIARNCPARTLHQQPTNQRNKIMNNEAGNLKIKGMNVCYFEINDIVKGEVEDEHEMPSWAQKNLKEASFVVLIIPKAWVNLSEKNDDYDNKTDTEDIMTMRRIEIDENVLYNNNEEWRSIVQKANNLN